MIIMVILDYLYITGEVIKIIVYIPLACLIAALTFLVLGIIFIFKKKSKKALIQFAAMIVSVILFVISLNLYEPEEEESSTSEKTTAQSEPKETIYLKFKDAKYSKSKEIVTANFDTNIEDGTTIDLILTNQEDDSSFGGNAQVQDGKVKIEAGDYDFVQNGQYSIDASVTVDDVNNIDFPERYGDYDEIQNKVKVQNGEIVSNDEGYEFEFNSIGNIKITNAYSKKEVAQLEKERKKQEEEKKKQSAKEIRFAELNKNPDKHTGEFVKYQGEIAQIVENDNSTDIRLAVTKTSYGYDFNDIVYITYDGTTPFVEEDKITVYGTIQGSYTYESTAGYQITLPHIEGEIIE
ncbi:hypothetical protein MOF05_21110 [Bacillus haynesii]|uniref:hypothetical protein n=1 Tax=Bacillus haynesii TaxID=1925021 RepID=UPI00227E937D|nr:hypothetical protein [Bacillus haynesii]MCY9290852.1 hypothetical protein [Bacillus haynesii]